MSEKDHEVPVNRSASDARATEAQAGTDLSSLASRFSETGHKMATDINTEEVLSGQSGMQGLLALLNATGELAHRQRLFTINEQALMDNQNAARIANLNAVSSAKIGDDRMWNVDEQGYQVAEILRGETFKDAIAAAVAVAVNEAMTRSG